MVARRRRTAREGSMALVGGGVGFFAGVEDRKCEGYKCV